MTPPSSFAHVTLSVTDMEASAAWYESVLGLHRAAERENTDWKRIVMRSADGLTIGLTAHHATDRADRFDERRVGLDHVSIQGGDRAGLVEWQEHLDALGVPHDGITDTPHAHVLVCRDPDGIPVEFFAPA